jgi:hypothetical protein
MPRLCRLRNAAFDCHAIGEQNYLKRPKTSARLSASQSGGAATRSSFRHWSFRYDVSSNGEDPHVNASQATVACFGVSTALNLCPETCTKTRTHPCGLGPDGVHRTAAHLMWVSSGGVGDDAYRAEPPAAGVAAWLRDPGIAQNRRTLSPSGKPRGVGRRRSRDSQQQPQHAEQRQRPGTAMHSPHL